MTKPIFIILRILIVALTFFILKWLFLSGPVITVGASQIHCRAVGWDYLGEPYSASGYFDIHSADEMDRFSSTNEIDDSLAEQRRARDNRKLYMNLTAIFAATAFITLPKPTQKKLNLSFLKKLKRKDDELVTIPESP